MAIVTILRYLAARPQDSEGAKIPLRPSAYCVASIPSRTPLSPSPSSFIPLSVSASICSFHPLPPTSSSSSCNVSWWCILIRNYVRSLASPPLPPPSVPLELVCWMHVSVSIHRVISRKASPRGGWYGTLSRIRIRRGRRRRRSRRGSLSLSLFLYYQNPGQDLQGLFRVIFWNRRSPTPAHWLETFHDENLPDPGLGYANNGKGIIILVRMEWNRRTGLW